MPKRLILVAVVLLSAMVAVLSLKGGIVWAAAIVATACVVTAMIAGAVFWAVSGDTSA